MLTIPAVRTWLHLAADEDTAVITLVVDAVNAWALGNLPAVADLPDPLADPWPTSVTQGLTMLAARLYRRRNTPSGVESFGDAGLVYLPRRDSDVDMLLGIAYFAKPQVG